MFIKLFALLALIFICLAVTVFFFIKKKIPAPIVAAILVIIAGGCAACFLHPGLRVNLNIPDSVPEECAEGYSRALSSGDFRQADRFILSGSSFAELECEDEDAALLLNKLLDGISLEPTGEAEVGRDYALQSFKLSFPDVTSRAGEIRNDAVTKLELQGKYLPRSQVYNPDKTYLESTARTLYSRVLKSSLKEENETVKKTVELKIVCIGGKWRISSDEALIEEISKVLGDKKQSPDKLLDEFIRNECETARLSAKYIEKHFTIDFDNPVSPEPDRNRYGITTDPAEVQRVVDGAAGLLQGQSLVWNPDIEIIPGSDIRYYYDDSILVIVWREERDGTAATFAEVKIADASQLRRKLANDQYNPPATLWKEATVLSEEANAVLATGSDLYAFRWQGIFSYGGKAYRAFTNYVQSCHITYSGDMLFTNRYELNSIREAQRYVEENDIMFTLAFGPVLVKDGEPWITYDYAIGEIFEEYARAAMGQLGELHYLMTVMNKDDKYELMRNPNLVEMQNLMIEKGCVQAYALDGGQTAAIIIDNEMITRPTYGWERIYCDILYFATAIPPEERLG